MPDTRKVLRPSEATIKSVGDGGSLGLGQFTALVSVFGNVDALNEVVMPGAFTDTLAAWKAKGDPIPVLYAHQSQDPMLNIGEVLEATETAQGLVVTAQLDMSNDRAVQVFKLLKDRRITQFSYQGIESDFNVVDGPDGMPIVQVGKVDLIEVSPCLLGANTATQLISTKSDPPAETPETTSSEPLTREQLEEMVREIARDELGTGDPPGEPEPETPAENDGGFSMPELTAWAADTEAALVDEGDEMSLKSELKDTLAQVKSLAEKAQAEKREFSEDEVAEVASLREKADGLQAKIEQADAAQAAVKSMLAAAKPLEEKPQSAPQAAPDAKSLGEAFVQTEAYKSFKKDGPSGRPVNIVAKGLAYKADPSPISTSLPGAIVPQMQPGYTDLTYPAENVFLSLITQGTTSSTYVQYRQLVSVTAAAATVAEGGLKPLSSLNTAVAEAHAWTAADGVKVTNQELADDGIISSLINSVLIRNVAAYEENLILNGDGTDGDPTGIMHTTGTQAVAFDTDVVTTISHAIRTLQVSVPGIAVQAVVLNPADNEALNLMKDTTGRFLSNAPFGTGPFTLFGVPRVTSSLVPEGTALLGDFRTVQLLQKDPLSIVAFNQNEDDARKNLTYVRAEKRDMLFIREPKRIAVATIKAS